MVYTVEEVAKMLKVSAATVRKLIKQGKIEAFPVGNQMRITKEALDRYMGVSS
jgi:excisionase family DNA binding protein